MSTKKVAPIEYVIHHFKGVRPLGRAIKASAGHISRLRRGGYIPAKMQQRILRAAARRQLPITAEHVVHGGEIPQ